MLQEHPDTVGGAMLTGVREAVRAFCMLTGDGADAIAAAAAQVDTDAVHRQRVSHPLFFPSCLFGIQPSND